MANANANKKAADANVKLAENQETLVAQQIKSAFSQYKILRKDSLKAQRSTQMSVQKGFA
jgi:hypothetical protein